MSHVTVMTGPERRRRWCDEDRFAILEAACAPGAIVADVARRYDVCTSLIYKWRRAAKGEAPAAFLPVMLSGPAGGEPPPRDVAGALVVELASALAARASAASARSSAAARAARNAAASPGPN